MGKQFSAFFLVIVLILLLVLHQSCSESEVKTGPATALLNRLPIDVICEIREDFKKVPKPVFQKIIFYGPWVERTFAAGTFAYSESYNIVLTREAERFLLKYSGLEIEVALTPLIVDEDHGVDVLAFFQGMRPRGKKRAIQGCPEYLMEKYGKVPATEKYLKKYFNSILKHTSKTFLDETKASIANSTWSFARRLRTLPRSAYSYNPSKIEVNLPPGTLDTAIRNVLEEYKEMRKKIRLHGFIDNKAWAARTDLGLSFSERKIEKLIKRKPVIPVIGPELKKFISNHDKKLLPTVMLCNHDIYTLGIILGLHKKYWLYYSRDWGAIAGNNYHGGNLYKQNFKTEVVNVLNEFCDMKK